MNEQYFSQLNPITLLERKDFNFEELDMQLPSIPNDKLFNYRFYSLSEISESTANQNRAAMANVIASLSSSQNSIVYLLSGTPQGVKLYLGVAGASNKDTIRDEAEDLKTVFEGNFLGAKFSSVYDDDDELKQVFKHSQHIGLITGVPSFNEEESNLEGEDFQGVERLVNSLSGNSYWQLVIVAQPSGTDDIQQMLDDVLDLSTELSWRVKQSLQHTENKGTSTSDTQGSSITDSINKSTTDNNSYTHGSSTSDTKGNSEGFTKGESHSLTSGKSNTFTKGENKSLTEGKNKSYSYGRSENKGTSNSTTKGTSSTNNGSESSHGTNDSGTEGSNSSWGTSKNYTNGTNKSETIGTNESLAEGTNTSKTKGTNNSFNKGTNESHSESKNESVTKGKSHTLGDSHSTGTNESRTLGTNESIGRAITLERINERDNQKLKHLNETQINRFRLGLNKGMCRTAIYICAENKSTYDRLSKGILSIYQGSQASYTPLKAYKLPLEQVALEDLLQIRQTPLASENTTLATINSIVQDSQNIYGATWLTTKELSLIAGLPSLELPGLKLRKSVSFALNTVDVKDQTNAVNLGNIVQDGRELTYKPILIPKNALDKHVFVTGVTGSGKTTTCMRLLKESGYPFMVIEPAKTEYRELYQHRAELGEVEYYALGREDLCTFRLNPFELVSPRQNLMGHISTLKAMLTAVFPMEASMPYMIENAIVQAYQSKGWDIQSNKNFLVDDPWNTTEEIYPTFSDMIEELKDVITKAGLGKEFEEKYTGSLVSRLESLIKGIKGSMINTPRSINFDSLLDKRVVIELEELKDGEDKAFFMALILARLAECMKYRHSKDKDFRHMTLVEEAHRLLSKPEFGDSGASKEGVEAFSNMLAEVRKYGECLIIADQIPNKLISDVIKNTNTKIVHRLFAHDDRNAMGEAMGLNENQTDFLPLLQPGETVIFSGGWHSSVRAQISPLTNTTGAVLDESLIREQGQKQLIENKARLFPRLSQRFKGSDQQFVEMFPILKEQTNLLIQVSRKYEKKKGTISDPIMKTMLQRLVKYVITFEADYGLDHNEWSLLVLDLILDASANKDLFSMIDYDMYKTGLPIIIEKLLQSEESLISYLFTNYDVFNNIKAKTQFI